MVGKVPLNGALVKATRKEPSANGTRLSAGSLAQNLLLRHLSGPDADRILNDGKLVHLKLREKIYNADAVIKYVYFPLTCVISVVAEMEDGGMIEVGTVGYEGVSAIPLVPGATSTANSYCQVPGEAIVVSTDVFAHLTQTNLGFRRLLDHYLQAYINLLGRLAACNRLHSVYERCARWILQTQDRVKSDKIPLTQEFLGMMLGSRRSGVTIAAATLRAAGFIAYSKGIITILDRPGLEDACCECYALTQERFGGLNQGSKRVSPAK